MAIADVASISGLFRKAFVSVLVSISIPEKISYSLLQSYGILWVSLEMGYTVYPPKLLSLQISILIYPQNGYFYWGNLGKMMVPQWIWGRQSVVLSAWRITVDRNVQGPGLWLATAVGRKVAQGSLRQHKRLRIVETWEVLTRKHLIYFHKIMDHGKQKTCPIPFVPLRGRTVGELFAGQKCRHLRDIAVQVGPGLRDWQWPCFVLCWVCELSATLLSYSRLTLCHQPTSHSVMNILSGQWFLNESSPFSVTVSDVSVSSVEALGSTNSRRLDDTLMPRECIPC